jgi:two-component system chemotaxis sensor kinase CheA
VAKEGARGTLVIALSRDRIRAAGSKIVHTTLSLGIATFAFGALGAWLIGRSMSRRLVRITRVANAVAEGNLAQAKLEDRAGDEVGQLARAFNVMLGNITELIDLRERAAAEEQTRLEALVGVRTAALDARNAEMRLVLDHVAEGLLTVSADGTIGRERSRAAEAWFGTPKSGATLTAHLMDKDASFAAQFAVGWDQVQDGFLPLDLALDQLPDSLECGGSTYRVTYQAMEREGHPLTVLVVATDITAELARAAEETERAEIAAATKQVFADRTAFAEFLTEAEALARSIAGATNVDAELGRALHTLKGNCGLIGLPTLAQKCHEMESLIAEANEPPPASDCEDVIGRIAKLREVYVGLVGSGVDRIEITAADQQSLLTAIDQGASRTELKERIRALSQEPTAQRFGKMADHVRTLAVRFDREIDVRIDDNGVRLDRDRWRPFWASFIHVVRNAVAHGIEDADERLRAGKPAKGSLTLKTSRQGRAFVIEVTDDGRGIDWEAVSRVAAARGLKRDTPDDLIAALFADGVSTARSVNDISGRGVGLSAVLSETRALGGSLTVDSQRGAGARFEFRFTSQSLSSRPPPPVSLVA